MWAYEDLTKKPKPITKWLSVPFAVICINIAILAGALFFSRAKITRFAIDRDTSNESFVETYKSRVLSFDKFSGYPGINKLIDDVAGPVTQNIFDTILSSTIPFIFKRDIMEEKVDIFSKELLSDAEKLAKIQEDITKYWYVHQDIMNILVTQDDIIPIPTLLHTIETVKFWTAFKIFSLLDTFLIQTSRLLEIDKVSLSDSMIEYSKKWEKDIDRFLNMCYLNPYESLPDCNKIGDFKRYFRYEEKDEKTDVLLLSKILVVISNKLEQTDLPSLQIAFDSFSPTAKELGFNVTINTLPEDEAAFISKGIINPHIFIISTLVNLLKQSIFVIGNTINVNKLNIQQKLFTIGDIQIPVSTSSMLFRLPLQWESEREIYDFFDFNALTWDIKNIDWWNVTWDNIITPIVVPLWDILLTGESATLTWIDAFTWESGNTWLLNI